MTGCSNLLGGTGKLCGGMSRFGKPLSGWAVEAEDAYTAKDAVRSRYRAGKIVLEADDFSDVEMEAEKAGEPAPRPFSMGREAFDQTL